MLNFLSSSSAIRLASKTLGDVSDESADSFTTDNSEGSDDETAWEEWKKLFTVQEDDAIDVKNVKKVWVRFGVKVRVRVRVSVWVRFGVKVKVRVRVSVRVRVRVRIRVRVRVRVR